MDLKDILHSTLFKSGVFSVDLAPFKTTLKEAIQNNRVRIMRGIEKQVNDENNLMLKEFERVQEELKVVPDS